MPHALSISRRIASVHGSAPKMPIAQAGLARIEPLPLELVERSPACRTASP